eukprot:1574575-Rhodomonas_salina.1
MGWWLQHLWLSYNDLVPTPSSLRSRYAMSGTETVGCDSTESYLPMHTLRHVRRYAMSSTGMAYRTSTKSELPTPCPILTERIVLPGEPPCLRRRAHGLKPNPEILKCFPCISKTVAFDSLVAQCHVIKAGSPDPRP